MKFRSSQPASLEACPEQDRIHLPGKLVDSPDTTILDDFTGRVERQAVELAKGVDLVPVLPDIAILQCDMIRPIGTPTRG